MKINDSISEVSNNYPVILFDGECALCDSWISHLAKWDKKRKLRFASLQSVHGNSEEIKNLIYVKGQDYNASSAVIMSFAALGCGWSILKILLLIPVFLRDPLYKLVARHRYQILGKKNICGIEARNDNRFLSV